MDGLAVELLEKIFSYLDEDSLKSVERVSILWSQIVVARFWSPVVESLSLRDAFLHQKFADEGWSSANCDENIDHELTKKIYLKLTRNWYCCQNPDTVMGNQELLQSCGPQEFCARQVSSFVVYKFKIFLGLRNGVIEIRSLPNFQLINRIEEENPVIPGHLLMGCQLAIFGKTLAFTNQTREFIVLYDAELETRMGSVRIPNTSSSPNARIYDLKMTSNLILCLWGWSLVVWPMSSSGKVPASEDAKVFLDLDPEPGYQNWLESHGVQANEDYVVTHATRNRDQAEDVHAESQSYIKVRKSSKTSTTFQLGPVWKPDFDSSGQKVCEIESIKLSSSSTIELGSRSSKGSFNLLAVLQLVRQDASVTFCYIIDILNLDTRQLIHTLNSSGSIFSHLQVPVQWFGKKLIFKEWREDRERLTVWDSSSHESEVISRVKMFSTSDQLQIDPFRVVHLYQRLPNIQPSDFANDFFYEDPPPGPEFQIFGAFYDFWNAQ